MPDEADLLQPHAIGAIEASLRLGIGHTILAKLHPGDWHSLIKALADLEATARVARQVAERQAEVA
jgi:hypothetical protein